VTLEGVATVLVYLAAGAVILGISLLFAAIGGSAVRAFQWARAKGSILVGVVAIAALLLWIAAVLTATAGLIRP